MSEVDELAHRIAACLLEQMKPPVPLTVDLWDVKTIAAYLKRDPDVTRERVCCLPGFPAAIRLPNTRGQTMRPLWKAAEVIAWAESFRERKPRD